jgi:hypothetical protein
VIDYSELKFAKPARRAVIRKLKPAQKERRKKALALIQAERDAKEEVRERDQHCRWPNCTCTLGSYNALEWNMAWMAQEVAHLKHKGIGGDSRLLRTRRDLMILLCRWRHRGPKGIDSKLAKIEPLTARGTDGP